MKSPLVFFTYRKFTPINESIQDWYQESPRGLFAAKEIARKAQDTVLLEKTEAYETCLNDCIYEKVLPHSLLQGRATAPFFGISERFIAEQKLLPDRVPVKRNTI